ncbi:carboxymuconolactone decarboxylase family protein [Paludibacterium yongneupense]|uniref:carboxymuconolactone decarboxylase family protein n=1 Tax=Paludibacterium yongneupense TaxID=400061 RepID=UPI000418F1F5|nr:carboxymuconolactone decarboxylase family protein [Paludibacterium yongneupense]
MADTIYERGLQRLNELEEGAGEHLVAQLADISPDFARYVIEFGYGEIHSRPGLTSQQRELAAIAALCATGNAHAQLRLHLAGALTTGLSHREIIEVIIQTALYAGFPAAQTALALAREVFAAHAQLSSSR